MEPHPVPSQPTPATPHHTTPRLPDTDVIIVGAGISGIAAAYYLSSIEGLTYTILDGRAELGGTWDIFRYPGVRSDTEMDSYSFSFHPYHGSLPLGSGEDIRSYLHDAARSHGILPHIQFRTHVTAANFDSTDDLWHLQATVDGTPTQLTCRFLHIAGGYFRHDHGYQPSIPGAANFTGTLIDPQNWPEDCDYAGRRVIVVGSGATAATLVPALGTAAAHVTLLQRSRSHMAPLPNHIRGGAIRRVLPQQLSSTLARHGAILNNQAIYHLARRYPSVVTSTLAKHRAAILTNPDQQAEFSPTYPVWDQRVCRIPDGDLFHTIAAGRASAVTDTIVEITADGITTAQHGTLKADIIVLATGLELQALGGIDLSCDGSPISLGETAAYRGMLLENVPNLSFTLGYVNESFTLRAELVGRFLTRILTHMRSHGYHTVTAPPAPPAQRVPIIDLKSSYVQRGIDRFPYVTTAQPYALINSHYQEARQFARADLTAELNFAAATSPQPTPAPAAPDATPRITTVTTSHGPVRVIDTGPDEGVPIVALHGIGRGAEDYTELRTALAGRRRLVALDTPGFGHTPAPSTITLEAIVAALWEAVDAYLGEGPITLVGHSLGGTLGMRMTTAHPDRIHDCFLLAPSGFSNEITSSVKLAATPVVGSRLMRVLLSAEKVQRSMYSPAVICTPELLDRGLGYATNPDSVATFVALSRELVSTPAHQRQAAAHAFAATTSQHGIPVAVLWGSEDSVLGIDQHTQAQRVLPTAFHQQLWGRGHMLPVEAADTLATHLTTPLEAVQAPAPATLPQQPLSVRMRASAGGEHISGAERIIPQTDLSTCLTALAQRAWSHPRGTAAQVTFTVENLEPADLELIPALPVTVADTHDPAGCDARITAELTALGLSGEACKSLLTTLRTTTSVRGAVICRAADGQRIDTRGDHGVRVSALDYLTTGAGAEYTAVKDHAREARAVASKAVSDPRIIAELCISDDPDYTTGYLATQEAYLRLPGIKLAGAAQGGRVLVYAGDPAELDACIDYLHAQPVLVTTTPVAPTSA